MSKIKISVVIPVFNREDMILGCINSVMNQTCRPAEIIVVDNNSSDNTFEVLNNLSRDNSLLKIYKNKENIGPVQNWIKAVEYAGSDVVKLLFSDDQIAPNFLEQTSKFLSENIAFVSTAVQVGKSVNQSVVKYKIGSSNVNEIKSSDYIKKSLSEPGVLVSPGAAIFRKVDILNSLYNSLNHHERGAIYRYIGAGPDLEIFLNSALRYEKVVHINEPLAFFLSHSNSATVIGRTQGKYPIKESYSQTKILFAKNSIDYLDPHYVMVRCFVRDFFSSMIQGGIKTMEVSRYCFSGMTFNFKNCICALFFSFKELASLLILKYYDR